MQTKLKINMQDIQIAFECKSVIWNHYVTPLHYYNKANLLFMYQSWFQKSNSTLIAAYNDINNTAYRNTRACFALNDLWCLRLFYGVGG